DIDGDGDIDIVGQTANAFPRAFINNGSGVFTPMNIGSMPDAGWAGVRMADMDNDGDLDVLTGNNSTVRIQRNNGGLSFTSINAGVSNGEFEVGDFNGDGWMDIVSENSGTLRIWLNDQTGAFPGFTSTLSTGSLSSFDVGDVNNDGRMDIVACGDAGTINQIWIGNGLGSFVQSATFGVAGNTSVQTRLLDWNGDGILDILDGNWTQTTVYLSDGVGGISGTVAIGGATDGDRQAEVGDFNGDGNIDVFRSYDTNFAVTLGDGSGGILQHKVFSGVISGLATGTVGDWDGDGDLDVVISNNTTTQFHYNQTINVVATTPPQNYPYALLNSNVSATFDWDNMNAATTSQFVVNGDKSGWRAGAVSGAGTSALTHNPTDDLLPNERVRVTLTSAIFGTGKSIEPYVFEFVGVTAGGPTVFNAVSKAFNVSTGGAPNHPVVGDFDNDGDEDILTVIGSALVYYSNDGNGQMTETWSAAAPTGAPTRYPGDFDNDGNLDVLSLGTGASTFVAWGTGTGTFTTTTVATSTAATGLAVADFDADGDLDFVVPTGAGTMERWSNNGNRTFTALTPAYDPTPSGAAANAAAGDLDSDGDMDLVLGMQGADSVRLLLNDGSFNFTLHSTLATPNAAQEPVIGDIDGDGDADIAIGTNAAATDNQIYLNQGGMSFTLSGTFGNYASRGEYFGLALVDYTGDGLLDIIDSDASQYYFYENTGGGSFLASSFTLPGGFSRAVAADFD
ncbi:MAG: VCBS repeat-containing protein, partial [Planctomycetes bacterium]|nr:VCBS repeat-containing protein [Planctomycetota bacterium]